MGGQGEFNIPQFGFGINGGYGGMLGQNPASNIPSGVLNWWDQSLGNPQSGLGGQTPINSAGPQMIGGGSQQNIIPGMQTPINSTGTQMMSPSGGGTPINSGGTQMVSAMGQGPLSSGGPTVIPQGAGGSKF